MLKVLLEFMIPRCWSRTTLWEPLDFFFFLIYFWLCWFLVSVQGLSLVAASGGHSSSRCAGLSVSRPLLLRGTGSRRAGSVVVAHGLSCSAACGIFPDQGSNPCPLHWQAGSQPLHHQGSPKNAVSSWHTQMEWTAYELASSHYELSSLPRQRSCCPPCASPRGKLSCMSPHLPSGDPAKG